MRICDLNTGRSRLIRAAKQLREQWDETRDFWNDQNSRDFARDHLEPISPQINLMLAAIHRLAEVLEQAERECLDENEMSGL